VSLAGWTFSDGINFTFGPNDVIPADGYLLVVPIDPAVYRSAYNVPAGGGRPRAVHRRAQQRRRENYMSKPGVADGQVTPFITVDRVNYDNNTPWPAPPDGTGPSVGRIKRDPIRQRSDSTGKPTRPTALAERPTPLHRRFSRAVLRIGVGPTVTIKSARMSVRR